MKALPKTRYVTVAAETWGLIRGAYLSGLSAPTVAAHHVIPHPLSSFRAETSAARRRPGTQRRA